MLEIVPNLTSKREVFIKSKELILTQWLSYKTTKEILKLHNIDEPFFLDKYANGVFDYFMGVISSEVELGNCPVMQELLTYLKTREISADELFEICTSFKHSMIDFTYEEGLNSKALFNEISYIFDANFKGILKFYTDTIFNKLILARQEALNASQAKEYFLSNMSHEIRTPLNAILGFVNLLLDDNISKKHRNYLDIIHNSGENLLTIINDILDFSKLRSGEFTLEIKSFSIHEEISHTLELFVASANAKEITLVSFIDPTIPQELLGDALRIKQILSNFLSNAIKFTPVAGVIKIEVYFKDSLLKISVKDNGIGISSLDIDKIFMAFAQAEHTHSSNEGGTGLGLSICNQLAKKMRGEVTVQSELGLGSSFFVTLPLKVVNSSKKLKFSYMKEFQKLKILLYAKKKKIGYKHDSFLRYAKFFGMNIEVVDSFQSEFDIGVFIYEELESETLKEIQKSNKKYIAIMNKEYDFYDNDLNITPLCFPLYCSKINSAFNELFNHPNSLVFSHKVLKQYKGHILVAEDNEANQELIKIVLKKYGLTFDMAKNGVEALELFKIKKYDLILMDEQMPKMSGNEAVLKIIEREEKLGIKHTPVSVVTANVVKGAKERGLISGFDAFLGKPIVLKELERVFSLYLKKSTIKNIAEIDSSEKIVGLNVKKLQEELMLEYDELLMLLKLYIKKMRVTLPKLENAIEKKDFKQIALLAHSIKGASGNFRIKTLQDKANEIEKMAKKESLNFNYSEALIFIELKIKTIRVE